MAIIDTITDSSHFYQWCADAQRRDSSYGHFTYEEANAIQAYFEELSEDIGEPIEFDPIAWCVEFTAYDGFDGFKNDTGWTDSEGSHEGHEDIKNIDDLRDHTTVIEVENGTIIVGEF